MSLALMPEPPRVPALDPTDRRRGPAFAAYKWGLAVLLGSVGLFVYQLIGRTDLHRSTTMLDTALDRAIPLLPWTTWFYEPFYAGIFVIALIAFSSRWLFQRALACTAGNATVAALGHFFIRAQYPRPILHPPFHDASLAFLAFVYRIDPPGNVFPSLHVAHAFTLAFLVRLDRPRVGTALLVMAVLLALSTLTTKQHFAADVVAGLIMAFVARALVRRRLPAPQR